MEYPYDESLKLEFILDRSGVLGRWGYGALRTNPNICGISSLNRFSISENEIYPAGPWDGTCYSNSHPSVCYGEAANVFQPLKEQISQINNNWKRIPRLIDDKNTEKVYYYREGFDAYEDKTAGRPHFKDLILRIDERKPFERARIWYSFVRSSANPFVRTAACINLIEVDILGKIFFDYEAGILTRNAIDMSCLMQSGNGLWDAKYIGGQRGNSKEKLRLISPLNLEAYQTIEEPPK